MTCTRLMHDQKEQIEALLDKVIANARDADMACYHIERARKVLDEMQREVFWGNRKSGESQ